ncbi:hypothetical protein SAMN05444266_108262 [Chitinophaga jiangningensis]|uniref:Uncharacterized protein n=1 Tax=Chitinophaga jiangningensis TaxID=1419482 RepID=A0A1M7J7Y4_9BACT|nr:hypothetical protein SAMN05444266_108262 [Chitinophaga jiangningensis]
MLQVVIVGAFLAKLCFGYGAFGARGAIFFARKAAKQVSSKGLCFVVWLFLVC